MDSYDHLDPLVAVIIRARKERGLTQVALAQAAGISRRALVMIERGGDCTLRTLRQLYGALDIHMQPGSGARPTLEDMDHESSMEMFDRPNG